MSHQEGTFKAAGGVELYYQGWQAEKSKATIALVHGFGEHSGRYNYLVDALLPVGISFFAYDQRGHGRSPGKRGYVASWSELDEDCAAFVQLVIGKTGRTPLFLMGHSMGGLVALHFVTQHSEQLAQLGVACVITSAPLLSQATLPPLIKLASRILLYVKPDLAVKTGLDANSISRDPAEVARYVNDPLVHSFGTPKLGAEIEGAQQRTLASAQNLSLPLLVYFGTGDQLVPNEGARRFYAAAASLDKTLREYPNGFHELHNDLDRATLFSELIRWIETHG